MARAVLDGYAHFNSTGAVLHELVHPNIEWHSADDLPDAGVYRGVAGVQRLFDLWTEAFDDFHAEVLAVSEHAGGVLTEVDLRGRMRASGTEVSLLETHLWEFRDGLAIRVREFRTTAEALAALGA